MCDWWLGLFCVGCCVGLWSLDIGGIVSIRFGSGFVSFGFCFSGFGVYVLAVACWFLGLVVLLLNLECRLFGFQGSLFQNFVVACDLDCWRVWCCGVVVWCLLVIVCLCFGFWFAEVVLCWMLCLVFAVPLV